jgi:hypothetical protein
MTRPLRLEFSGALDYVAVAGNDRCDIFLGNTDADRDTYSGLHLRGVQRRLVSTWSEPLNLYSIRVQAAISKTFSIRRSSRRVAPRADHMRRAAWCYICFAVASALL